ncbi:MAG: hypothetical protein IPI49_10850 [Myxococcales bacterium]|nr:hypothetical protein [Myxococcales bacterium]
MHKAALAGAVAAASAARLAAEQHAAAVAIASAETLPVTRPGAPRRSTTSDILPKNKKRKRPKTSQSVVVDPSDPAPLALVADLQAAHDAVSGLAAAQAAAAASPDVGAAGAALSAVAQQVTEDASKAVAAFTADEEAFFQAGHHHHHHPVDSFADLDVGHRRPSFWQRLFGRPVPRE